MSAIVRVVAIALIGALALATTACTDASPAPTPSPTPKAEAPIFASDEEALAAAEAAYARYNELSAEISHSGGKDPERIRDVVTSDYADSLITEFNSMAERGLRTAGSTSASGFALVQADLELGAVQTYACLSVGDSRILREDGSDITPPDRPQVVAVVLSFATGESGNTLLLEGSEQWQGEDFCQ